MDHVQEAGNGDPHHERSSNEVPESGNRDQEYQGSTYRK